MTVSVCIHRCSSQVQILGLNVCLNRVCLALQVWFYLSVMQVSEAVPFPSGLLDENPLIGYYNLNDSSLKKFRYFVVDSSVIMAMLEQPQGPEGGSSWLTEAHLSLRHHTQWLTAFDNTNWYWCNLMLLLIIFLRKIKGKLHPKISNTLHLRVVTVHIHHAVETLSLWVENTDELVVWA